MGIAGKPAKAGRLLTIEEVGEILGGMIRLCPFYSLCHS